MPRLDETHRADLKSWLESANAPGCDFPIQNLPFGVFKRANSGESPRAGVAIGNSILDLTACAREGLFSGEAAAAASRCSEPRLNDLAEMGNDAANALRLAMSRLLRADSPPVHRDPGLRERILVRMSDAELRLPIEAGDYTDFYTSIAHATNLGSMFRPDTPLLPNYKFVPIGYHGRASSLVVSGTPVRRPKGQVKDEPQAPPVFAPTKRLDYELEVGAVVGVGNALGTPVTVSEARRHVFGFCLVNDWSARDIQSWEYQPLGPFLGKSFATTLSPWIITQAALEPFRAPAFVRPADDPAPLPYLIGADDQREGALDVLLEVWIATSDMRARGEEPIRLSRGRLTEMYWTWAQLVAHHTSNGCNLRPGDLLASGTISGTERDARGSLMELAWRGTEPVRLPDGERRAFLQDGDEVIMRAYCERDGFARIGFGDCRGTIEPATS